MHNMSSKWLVVFGSEGWEMLVPCDAIINRDFLQFGDEKKLEMPGLINIAMTKARANSQRHPEVWAYDTEQDFSEAEMRSMWEESPQGMADLVRGRGKLLFREARGRQVIN
jgi:hypothetical protein